MNKLIIKKGYTLIIFGLCFFANVATAQNDQSGPGYTPTIDKIRGMTYATHLRNSEIDRWKYMTDLRGSFEREILAAQANQVFVQEVRAYCASDTDSYTCNSADLIISADDRVNSAVRDWQQAVLNIIEIEIDRNGTASGPRYRQLNAYNVIMSDIERLNERAKVDYNLAAQGLVEFQRLNPLLFSVPES